MEFEKDKIGLMQVHLRLYHDNALFETCVINAFRVCYRKESELVHLHFQVVPDDAGIYDELFQVRLFIPQDDKNFILHMPIHESEAWEQIELDDRFILGFYCILGKPESG